MSISRNIRLCQRWDWGNVQIQHSLMCLYGDALGVVQDNPRGIRDELAKHIAPLNASNHQCKQANDEANQVANCLKKSQGKITLASQFCVVGSQYPNTDRILYKIKSTLLKVRSNVTACD